MRVRDRPGHVRWLRVDLREIDYQPYTRGTLVVDIADRERHLLVWHGTVEGTVNSISEVPGDNLEKAVDRVIGRFPPRWDN